MTTELVARIEALGEDERAIFDLMLARLEIGRSQYGPWDIRDGRNYPRETIEEICDALQYSAVMLLRIDRGIK